jgi:hypothetical protein
MIATAANIAQFPAGMYTYRVTIPSGYSAIREANVPAILADIARPGWTVEIVGGSRVTIIED